MSSPNLVRASRTYAFDAGTVYDAWLTPALARRFLFATPPKGEVVVCEIDARVGGGFRIVDRRPLDDDAATIDMLHTGRYLQLDRPRRIAFGFTVPQFSERETTVVIDIEAAGTGCTLTLRHDLGPPQEDGDEEEAQQNRERTLHGWTTILAHLDEALQT